MSSEGIVIGLLDDAMLQLRQSNTRATTPPSATHRNATGLSCRTHWTPFSIRAPSPSSALPTTRRSAATARSRPCSPTTTRARSSRSIRRRRKILDLDCYARLQDAPHEIDLALICTPARMTPEMVRQCGEKGVKGALLLAGGFSEASEEGRKLEEETAAVARQYGVRLIGPNTNGMFSARYSCNAIAWFDIPRGPIAVLSNSANVALSLVTEAQIHRYIGYSTMLSVGNQADLQFHEYLEALGEDPDTKVIMSYVEGFKNGRAYLDAARKVTPVKPIVIYKAGRTAEGVSAAKIAQRLARGRLRGRERRAEAGRRRARDRIGSSVSRRARRSRSCRRCRRGALRSSPKAAVRSRWRPKRWPSAAWSSRSSRPRRRRS